MPESESEAGHSPPPVREQEINRLRELLANSDTASEFRSELLDLFQSGSVEDREGGAHALAKLAEQSPEIIGTNIDLLSEALAVTSDSVVRLQLARAIAFSAPAASEADLSSVRGNLQDELSHSAGSTTGYLLEALTATTYRTGVVHPPTVDSAGELLTVDSPVIRYQAVEYLAAAAKHAVDTVVPYTDQLVAIASDGPADEREQALRALRWLTSIYPEQLSKTVREELVNQGLKSTQPAIRREAARMAGNLLASGDLPEAFAGELEKLLEDTNPAVREEAARAILIISRENVRVFDNPEALAGELNEIESEYGLESRYGEQYHDAIANLRTERGGTEQ